MACWRLCSGSALLVVSNQHSLSQLSRRSFTKQLGPSVQDNWCGFSLTRQKPILSPNKSTKTLNELKVTLAAHSAEDRLQSGSADNQSLQHLYAFVTATPNPGSRTRPQPAIDHYGAVSTFHDDNIGETCFSMLCTSCLELTTENCSQ